MVGQPALSRIEQLLVGFSRDMSTLLLTVKMLDKIIHVLDRLIGLLLLLRANH